MSVPCSNENTANSKELMPFLVQVWDHESAHKNEERACFPPSLFILPTRLSHSLRPLGPMHWKKEPGEGSPFRPCTPRFPPSAH